MPTRPTVRIKKSVVRITSALVLASLTLPLSVSQRPGAIGLSTQLGRAANTHTSSQRSDSKLVALLLASTREENPARAIELLGQAREELKKENLGDDENRRILTMIEDLESKARARLDRKKPSSPPTSNRSDTLAAATSLPTIVDLGSLASTTGNQKSGNSLTNSEVESVLAAHPEVRDTLWEIGRGRLARDARNLEAIIQDKTGKTLEQIDIQEAQDLAEAYKPGAFLELLRKANFVNFDVSKANLKLKQEYDGIALDVIADQLTRDAMRFSIPAGFLEGTLADIGAKSKFLGLASESLVTFAINSQLALRISDLYSIELSESEKEIVLLLIFTGAKVAARYGPGTAKSMMGTLAENLGRLKFEEKAGALVASLKRIMGTPAVAAISGSAIVGPQLVTSGEAAKADVDAKAEAKTTHADSANGPKKTGVIKSIAGRINFAMWLKSGLFAARSGAETYAVGQAANWLFSGMHQTKRKIHNENFRRFLMTPTGEGFTKLLILGMNDGVPSTATASNSSATTQMKAKTDFVINIARSARVCTDDDLKAISTKAASATALYACEANGNTARFLRLKNEILTFNEIPQDYIADLRLVSREHRLRMADLILQMQFLDGDRSPSETEFFRNVVAKTLGVDSREDLEYFERLHSFIQENGGIVRSAVTPTGFMIRPGAKAHEYDMDRGYSPLKAPEPPSGERYLGPPKMAPAGAIGAPLLPDATAKK